MNVCLHDYRIDLSKWATTVGEGIVADIAHRDSSGESGGRYLICLNEGIDWKTEASKPYSR